MTGDNMTENNIVVETTTDKLIDIIFNKGEIVDGYDSREWRKDMCGAWIRRSGYNSDTRYGWRIVLKVPERNGGFKDDYDNLLPLQYNNAMSKGDNYPEFDSVVTSSGNLNVPKTQHWVIDDTNSKLIMSVLGYITGFIVTFIIIMLMNILF